MTTRSNNKARELEARAFIANHVDLAALGMDEDTALSFATMLPQEAWAFFFRWSTEYERAKLNGSLTPRTDSMAWMPAELRDELIRDEDWIRQEIAQEQAIVEGVKL